MVTGCISISAFASFFGIPLEITSSAIGLQIFTITAGIKKYKLITKKEKRSMIKKVLLAKTKLNNIKVFFKDLIDSKISQNEFVGKNSVLKEYDNMKNEINNLKT